MSQEYQRRNDPVLSRYVLRVVDHGDVTSLPLTTSRGDSKLFCSAECQVNDGCNVFNVLSGICYLYTHVPEGDMFLDRQLKYYVRVMNKVPPVNQVQGMLVAIPRRLQTKHIMKLNLSTGQLAKNYTLKQKIDMSSEIACSSNEKKMYLIQAKFSKISVWILGHNQTEFLLNVEQFHVLAVAADSQRKLLFATMSRSIAVLNEAKKPQTFQRLTGLSTSYMYLALDTKRGVIFASNNVKIITAPYSGKIPQLLYKGKWLYGLACDSKTGSIYFGQNNAVRKISSNGKDKKVVMEMDQGIWKIQVYRDVVYIAAKVRGIIVAADLRSGNILWSKALLSGKQNILFCIMD